MFYMFVTGTRLYVTAGPPGTEAKCVGRIAIAGRGHPTYSVVTRHVPKDAVLLKRDPAKTVRQLLLPVEPVLRGN